MAFGSQIVWQKSLTPAASPASIAVNEQAFTTAAGDIPEQYNDGVNGTGFTLAVGDAVTVTPPAGFDTTLIGPVYARVSTGGKLGTAVITIGFLNLTAAAHTPTAGVYTFTLNRQ